MENLSINTAVNILKVLMEKYEIIYSEQDFGKIYKDFTITYEDNQTFYERSEDELEEILFELLTAGNSLESRKKSGSERTPSEIVNYMLDLAEYKEENNILDKKIIDPSCGTGTFISEILKRFIHALYIEKKPLNIMEKLLKERNIQGYDISYENVFITKIVMISILIRERLICKIEEVLELIDKLPVLCEDFLHITEQADYVIGNPPYIRVQNLSDEYKEFIKKHYISATGRFDIYVCFIENGERILKENGKLCLITSNKFLTANYGKGIRDYLVKQGHVRKIVDLYDTKFFGAAVLPAILLCENSESDGEIEYIGVRNSQKLSNVCCENPINLFEYIETLEDDKRIIGYTDRKHDKVSLEICKGKAKIPENGKTWNFSSEKDSNIKQKMENRKSCILGEIFDICVGVKTTADTVFVKPMTEEFIREKKFEKEIIYPLIQSFDVEKWKITWGKSSKDRYILYPHEECGGYMSAVALERIPHAAEYLKENESILKKRSYLSESKTRNWYECWVPQKLSKFRQPKIVTRDIVSHNAFAYDNSGKLCQGNTFFLTRKTSALQLEYLRMPEEQYYLFMLGVLNSRVMEYYQKIISGCLYSQKYRYTTTNLSRWPIPEISYNNALKISDNVKKILEGHKNVGYMEKEIDDIIYSEFDLTEQEIVEIEMQ